MSVFYVHLSKQCLWVIHGPRKVDGQLTICTNFGPGLLTTNGLYAGKAIFTQNGANRWGRGEGRKQESYLAKILRTIKNTVFENRQKSLVLHYCERSELRRIFEFWRQK